RFLLRSETEFDAEVAEPAGVDVGRAVGCDDLNAASAERARRRKSGPSEPHHERPARQPCLAGGRLVGTLPAQDPPSPPLGCAGPLGSRDVTERTEFVSSSSRIGEEFVVGLPGPQERRPLTTASSPTRSTLTCANPAASSARPRSSPP